MIANEIEEIPFKKGKAAKINSRDFALLRDVSRQSVSESVLQRILESVPNDQREMKRSTKVTMLCVALIALATPVAAQTVRAQPLPTNPMPVYPAMLREAGLSGRVRMEFVVDSSGFVVPSSIRSRLSGYTLFREALQSVLLQWRFKPARQGRIARSDTLVQTVDFVPPAKEEWWGFPPIISPLRQVSPSERHLVIRGPDSMPTLRVVDTTAQRAIAFAVLDTLVETIVRQDSIWPTRIACLSLSAGGRPVGSRPVGTPVEEPSVAMLKRLERPGVAFVAGRRCPRSFGSPVVITRADGSVEPHPLGEDPFVFTVLSAGAFNENGAVVDVEITHATSGERHRCFVVPDSANASARRATCRQASVWVH